MAFQEIPWTPWSVGGVHWYWTTPQKSCWGSVGSIPSHQVRWGSLSAEGCSCLRGQPLPQVFQFYTPVCWLGCNSAPPALIFSIPVSVYYTARCIFDCLRGIPEDGIPVVADILLEASAVRRAVHAVPRADHLSHLGEVPLTNWQYVPCNWVRKTTPGGRYLAWRRLAFLSLDSASHLLVDPGLNITVKTILFPLPSGQAPAFEWELDWI